MSDGVAVGDDAMTVLENIGTRTLFVNELLEVCGQNFLQFALIVVAVWWLY